jgi:hypothetical protein
MLPPFHPERPPADGRHHVVAWVLVAVLAVVVCLALAIVEIEGWAPVHEVRCGIEYPQLCQHHSHHPGE